MICILRLVELIGGTKPAEAENVAKEAAEWGVDFLQCGRGGLRGFEPCHITPYIHVAMAHAAYQVAEVGPLNRFSGEALEHCNDEF